MSHLKLRERFFAIWEHYEGQSTLPHPDIIIIGFILYYNLWFILFIHNIRGGRKREQRQDRGHGNSRREERPSSIFISHHQCIVEKANSYHVRGKRGGMGTIDHYDPNRSIYPHSLIDYSFITTITISLDNSTITFMPLERIFAQSLSIIIAHIFHLILR